MQSTLYNKYIAQAADKIKASNLQNQNYYENRGFTDVSNINFLNKNI